jgi:hypothetical protein
LAFDRAALVLPAVLAVLAMLREEHGLLSNPHVSGVVFTPALVVLVFAGALAHLAVVRRQQEWAWLAAQSALIGVLLWQGGAAWTGWNWSVAAFGGIGALGAWAAWRHQPTVLALAAGAASALLAFDPAVLAWLLHHDLPAYALGILVTGTVVVLVAVCTTGARPPVWRVGLWVVLAGAGLITARHGAAAGITVGAWIVLLHALTWWRTRDGWSLLPLLVPAIAVTPFLLPAHKGWLAVWVAFLLLGAGVALSWQRVRRARRA